MIRKKINFKQSQANLVILARFLTTPLIFLLFVTLTLNIAAVSANICDYRSFDRRALVTFVNDGDTVKLSNGDKVRLIGINTPEMNYKKGRAEPYARKAKRFLEKLVLNKRVGIKYGRDKKDHYKRKLAHLFLLDGTNIQAEILKAGLAFNISIPRNLWRHRCYQKIEKLALKNKLGIWNSPFFRPIKAKNVDKRTLGFKRVTGRVEEVKPTKKYLLLRLSKKMSLKISKKYFHYFKQNQLKSLLGKKITASGWVSHYKRRFSMQVKHPSAITFE